MTELKTITLGDALDAIEKNGYPKTKYIYYEYSDGEIIGACAIGQGALNLGVDASALHIKLDTFKTSAGARLGDSITKRNDGNNWSCKTIARHYRAKFAAYLDEVFQVAYDK